MLSSAAVVPAPVSRSKTLGIPCRYGLLVLVALGTNACRARSSQPKGAVMAGDIGLENIVTTIKAFKIGVSGMYSKNPDVKLRVGPEPTLEGEQVLFVDYPAPTNDPAGRDTWCDAEATDWSAGHAVSFRVKPDHAVELSVSFFDRNAVAYTSWFDLQGGSWQPVRISFEQVRPNPYFQRPDAKVGFPIDVTEVRGLAFAPHDETPGHLIVSKIVLSR